MSTERNGIPHVQSAHVVSISAKSKSALIANTESLLTFMQRSSPDLASLSYTTTARRIHHPWRVVAHGSELSEICKQFQQKLGSDNITAVRNGRTVALAFTGQGSQYPGMARELLHFKVFKRDMEGLNVLCQKLGYPAVLPLIETANGEGDITAMSPTMVQLAATCSQIAMARLWQSWGIKPVAVVGHSLGEYAALNVAGVLSDADTIMLTGKRAQLLTEKCTHNTHAMLAIGASLEDILKTNLRGCQYEVACKNGPREVVLSGTNETIDKLHEELSDTGFRLTRLRVPFAFHSSQVQPILADFEQAAKSVTFHTPQIPVISPLLGKVISEDGVFSAKYLSRHCRETVDFAAAMSAAKPTTIGDDDIWIEIGPHPVVSGLLRNNLGSITTLPTLQRNKDTWKELASSMACLHSAGVELRWTEYHSDFKNSCSVLNLPSYNWDLKNYWMQYVNDWSLYKGDAAFLTGTGKTTLSTTSCQRIVEEKAEDNTTTVIVESDLLREDLDPMIGGHRVNGVALCTPSVDADMALTVGNYLRKQRPDWAAALVDVQHMDVQRPLVAKSKGSGVQLLRAGVKIDWQSGKGDCEFFSVTSEGKRLTRHAVCEVNLVNFYEALAEQQAQGADILQRIVKLRKSIDSNPRVQKMYGNTGYKLVSSLATYDEDFKGVEEVVLDSENLEATAKVKFSKAHRAGTYHVNPHLIDNFGQPALFIMNANDTADLDKEVFVNHGWSSLHFYKPVSLDGEYTSYVKMSGPKDDGMYSGDMIVFEGSEVVAAFKGIKAQGVPRRLMNYIVHMRDDTKQGAPRGGTMGLMGQGGDAVASVQVPSNYVNPSTVDDRPDPISGHSGNDSSWSDALRIISEESGVPVTELMDNTSFADLGVDSLLSLLCASRFREELGLAHESTIFADCPTVKALRDFWMGGTPAAAIDAPTGRDAILHSMFHDDPIDTASSSGSDSAIEIVEVKKKNSAVPLRPATSLLLQGNPATPTTVKTLFMLPDGSGSSSSYAALPRIHPSIAVVGLNCPYMKEPHLYTGDIEEVGTAYIHEIQRRQPHGPYALGGWSVGGIFAYHVAQRLIDLGEEVTNLVLIDCPVPRGLDHLPKRYYEYCDRVGLLGEVNGVKRAPPSWLTGHFEACVHSLHDHHASAMNPFVAPQTTIIWACDAIDKHVTPRFERRPDDPNGLKFLTEARTDFGTCGWEALIPEENCTIFRTEGANHFSMMKGEHAKRLSEFIESTLLC
jgi:iterative type I PKS product template protein